MENTNEKQEFEFSLFSFLKIFKGKLKMLIAIGLISAMLGGTVGALSVVLGKKEYGNLLTFQFPTPEQSGYSTVIPLLESDLFTEKILIGTKQVDFTDANGITTTLTIPDLPYNADQEKAVAEYEHTKVEATKKIKLLKEELKEIPFELNFLKTNLEAKTSIFAPIEKEYETIWKMYSDTLYEDAKKKLEAIQGPYDTAKSEYEAAQNAYNDCFKNQKQKEAELFHAENDLNEATEKSNEILDALRAEWRKDKKNKALVDTFHEGVKYSFTKDGSPLPVNNTGKEDTSGKFIYIDVRIPKDEALASKIINNIVTEIAPFVISNTTPVEKNDAIKCVPLSTGTAKDINEDSLIKNIIIFAVIFFAAFELLTCGIIIVSHIRKALYANDETASDKLAKEAESTEEKNENDNQ